nr:DNRLRE domain-containing protein [Chloroflexota bacterium]
MSNKTVFCIRLAFIALCLLTGLLVEQQRMPSKADPIWKDSASLIANAHMGQNPANPATVNGLWLPCEGTPEPGASLLVFQQGMDGYAGAEDTTLARYEGNLSDKWFLRVGYKNQNSALIRFDVSSIPPGSRVICAALSLYAEMWGGPPFELAVGAYYVKRDWVASEATWHLSSAQTPWQVGGCNGSNDRAQVPASVITIKNIRTWYHFDLTQVVDGWVNGSLPNYGVSLQPMDALDLDLIWFAASDDVDTFGSIANRPKLIVLYVPPPTPTPTPTFTSTATPTSTPTETAIPTDTATPIVLPTETATPTLPVVPTETATPTLPVGPTETPTLPIEPTETATPTLPVAPTEPPTPSPTATPITPVAPTETPMPTPTTTLVAPTSTPMPAPYRLFIPVLWRNYSMRCVAWGYSFAEEFNDPTLSSWSGSLNGGRQEVSGGVLHQWTQPPIDRFPLLWHNHLFEGAGSDFAFEVRFRYSNFAAYGTTIALNSAPVDGNRIISPLPLAPGMEDVLNIHHVVDTAGNVYRFDISLFKGRLTWIGAPGDTSWHEVLITVERGEIYTLYVDGRLVGSIRSTTRPASIYIGNPTIQTWPGAWTQLYVDYVRISRCMSWGLD